MKEKWTREDNKNIIHFYFTQRKDRKQLKEIKTESAKFDTSRRFDDQSRLILKKGWFFNLEILEIYGQVIVKNIFRKRPLNKLIH